MTRFTIQANSKLQLSVYDNLKGCYTAHFMTGKSREQIASYIEKLNKKYRIK